MRQKRKNNGYFIGSLISWSHGHSNQWIKMYESNNDSFELMFQQTSLLDDQPWNKGHAFIVSLYPQRRRIIVCLFRQETSDYLGIHPDCSSWLVPSLLSCCIWLWSASFSRDFFSISVSLWFFFHTFHQLGSNLREFLVRLFLLSCFIFGTVDDMIIDRAHCLSHR